MDSLQVESLKITDDISFLHEIIIIRNAFKLSGELIKIANDANKWKKSATHDETLGLEEASNRTSFGFSISTTAATIDSFKKIDVELFNIFHEGLKSYANTIGPTSIGITQDSGYDMLKYEVGGHYHVHVDRGSNIDKARTISGLVYLNDDYVGGELYFPRQKVKIKPEEGMLVLFPAIFTHPHASLDIISGTKYCVVTWFS